MSTNQLGSTDVNFQATLESSTDIGVYKSDKVNYLGFSYGWHNKGETANSKIASYGCFWQPKARVIPESDWTANEKKVYEQLKKNPFFAKRTYIMSAEKVLETSGAPLKDRSKL
jgi:hypothetical protein